MSKFIQDLETVVSQLKPYLKDYLQERGIDTSKNFKCINPEHEDNNPSAKLIDSQTNPRVYCFSCGKWYDIVDCTCILEKKPRVGLSWVHETLKYLAEKFKVDVKFADLTDEQIYELDTYRAYRLAASMIQVQLEGADKRFDLLKKEAEKRGWNEEIMKAEGVGTVPDYLEFRNALKVAGFAATFIDEIDLGRRDIFNPENMIFTWKDEFGRPIGFTARNMLYEKQKAEADKEGRKCTSHKYNNQRTTGLKCNIFQKGKRLYGIDAAAKAIPPLYIFEGQADVLTARQAGLENCVALAGSSLSTEHVHLLTGLKCYDLILALDADETGQTKQTQILEEKLAGHRDLRVRLVVLPEGEDPDSFIRREGLDAFKDLATWSAFEWRLMKFNDSEDATAICKQMIPFIVNESSPVEREILCKALSKRTGITLRAIQEELNVLLNAREYEKSRERQEVIDKTVYQLQRTPTEAELIIQEAGFSLNELSRKHNADALSSEAFLAEVQELKTLEENNSGEYDGFRFGPDLQNLQDSLCGNWAKDVLLLYGGKENVGKCQSGKTLITLKDGSYKRLDDCVKEKTKEILSLNQSFCLEQDNILNWIESGMKECFELQTDDGIVTYPTKDHKFLTLSGWKTTKELKEKDQIAIVSRYPSIQNGLSALTSSEAVVIAAFLAEGSCQTGPRFSNFDEEIISYFKDNVLNIFPKAKFTTEENGTISVSLANASRGQCLGKNIIRNLLKKYKILGCNSYQKRIPQEIFSCSNAIIGTFLGMFYACDGWVTEKSDTAANEIGISLCNKEMITQIRSLLLRFNIRTKIHSSTSAYEKEGQRFPRFTLSITDLESMKKFYNNIRIPLSKKKTKLFNILRNNPQNNKTQYLDNFPQELWIYIKEKLQEKGKSFRELLELIDPLRTTVIYKKEKDLFAVLPKYLPNIEGQLNRKVLKSIGYILQDQFLISLSVGDITFTKIKSISSIGEELCYDLTVEKNHNYVSNDIITHNSGFFAKCAYELANCNPEVISIILTIDDSKELYIPRFVTIAEGSRTLTLNQVRNPGYWESLARQYPSCRDVRSKREVGYSKVLDLIQQRKLVIKDQNNGSSLQYIDSLICYFQDKYPERKVVFFLDNFHKLSDFSSAKDERVRFKSLSKALKDLATKRHVTINSTVEYTKLPPGTKPNNHSVAESVQLAYDANLIAHLYSEVSDIPDKYTICHQGTNWRGESATLPRIELNIGKNKISDAKEVIWFDFWPASSDYRMVDKETVAREQEVMKERRRNTRRIEDPFNGAFE